MVFMTQDAVPADEFLVEKLVELLLFKGKSGVCAGTAECNESGRH